MTGANEVVTRSARRFTAALKLRILSEADVCTKPGEWGASLQPEGLPILPSGPRDVGT